MQFEELVVSAQGRLLRVAYLLCRDRQVAEDLVQETLAIAYAKWSRVAQADDPHAYVRRILINHYLGTKRRKRVLEVLVHRWSHREPAEDSYTAVSERSYLRQLLGELSPRARTVLVLRYYVDLPDREIANLLGIREVTVRTTATRALAAIRASDQRAPNEKARLA